MLSPFYLSAIAGFVAMGLHRYVVSPGWNLPKFLASEPRAVLKSAVFAAVAVYFAADIAALVPKQLMGVSFDAEATLSKAPKFSGFVLGFLMSSPQAGTFLLNILELIPVVGPMVVKVFRKQA
jgi:hypothetical protein